MTRDEQAVIDAAINAYERELNVHCIGSKAMQSAIAAADAERSSDGGSTHPRR